MFKQLIIKFCKWYLAKHEDRTLIVAQEVQAFLDAQEAKRKQREAEEDEERKKKLRFLYSTPVSEVIPSGSVYLALKRERINYLGQLIQHSQLDLLEIDKIGKASVRHIDSILKSKYNLRLGEKLLISWPKETTAT